VQKAFASGLFIFADADLKFDQPQAEVVFDRDKLRSQGVDLTQAGQDLSTMLGGDYVNRFSIQGRSYKVIPQIKRAERLTPDQLTKIYVTGSDDKLVPLSTFATLRTSAEPRELKKFQQLNAVRIQGVIPPPVPLDQALSFLEQEARAILPQGFTIDYAGESRQLRTEGSKFLGTFLLSGILIYLVLAAQFESFRDPSGSGRAQQHRHHVGERDDRGDTFHTVGGTVNLPAGGAEARGRSLGGSAQHGDRPLVVSVPAYGGGVHGARDTTRMKTRWILAIVTAGLLTSCTVSPNYRRPIVKAPDVFRGSADTTPPADLGSLADLKWFEVFKDEQLQELIRTALVQNYDLRDAIVRVEAARATLGITRADQFPT